MLACFFLLGMGLITFTNATKQAADYFNHRYKVCTYRGGVCSKAGWSQLQQRTVLPCLALPCPPLLAA